MPVERLPATDMRYYLIAFDENGRERTDDPDGLMSRNLLKDLKASPVTDLFFFSHGWKGDIPAARDQYQRWIGALLSCQDDRARAASLRPGFTPLFIGLHWESLPWGDETFGTSASFAPTDSQDIDELVASYARRIAPTEKVREALRTIFTAALQDISPPTLPQEVRDAYEVLNAESGLGSDGECAAPGMDREPFDPESAYQNAREEVSFGGLDLSGLLSPLRQLSFWKMKERARRFGESGGYELLTTLQKATAGRDVRVHLMGHSFGCIVVSAMVAGPGGQGELLRPVDSLVLVQGAMSLWSYCCAMPWDKTKCGYFKAICADNRVMGPIVTTQSRHDTAVGRYYPLAAGSARQVSFAPGELPKYGGFGTFGARGEGIPIRDLSILPADARYRFEAGAIYNVESSAIIRTMDGVSGAHSDIAHPEIAHLIWEAALS